MNRPSRHPALIALLGLCWSLRLPAEEPPFVLPPPPAWIKPAFERGQVSVEFSDPAQQPRAFPGWTHFDSKLTYHFRYEYQTRKDKQNTLTVTLMPRFDQVRWVVRHQIQLPVHLKSPRVWEVPLARHELEHVGIGEHRRIAMLAEHLVHKIQRIERTVGKQIEINPAWAEKIVQDEITPRGEALEELIKANNRQLDKLTGHGARELGNRDTLFGTMYLKENLDEMKFPYLAEVLELLDTPDYLAARWESPPKVKNMPDR